MSDDVKLPAGIVSVSEAFERFGSKSSSPCGEMPRTQVAVSFTQALGRLLPNTKRRKSFFLNVARTTPPRVIS